MCVFVCACVRACVCACVRACVRVCVCVYWSKTVSKHLIFSKDISVVLLTLIDPVK